MLVVFLANSFFSILEHITKTIKKSQIIFYYEQIIVEQKKVGQIFYVIDIFFSPHFGKIKKNSRSESQKRQKRAKNVV